MQFSKNIAGRIYQADSADAFTYTKRSDGRFAGTSVATDIAAYAEQVVTTGWYEISLTGKTAYQITTGEYIFMDEGWKQVGTRSASKSDAQRLVNKIIDNNKIIIANNLLCARFSNKLTESQLQQLRQLQQRLEARNSAIADSGLCTGLTQTYPAGYAELQPYLDKVMQGSAVSGIGSVTVTIIVTAIIIASLSTAAYFAYKYYAEQSEQDVKYSKELTKILTEKLTPEEYQQLLNETKGIVTKARILSTIGGYGKMLTLIGVGFGAYFIYKLLRQNGN